MKEGWMKNDLGWMKNDEERMMISSCWGVLFSDGRTDGQMDGCECRVAFANEKQ